MRGVILVGGAGTRLRPLTLTTPKAMVPVLGRPFLEHMLVYLRNYGVDEVMLALGHQPEPIRAYFGDGSRLGITLDMVVEAQPLGSGGAIKQFQSRFNRPFFAFNGDVLTSMNLAAMQQTHREAGAALSISLIEVDDVSSFGIAELVRGDRIVRFVEKPTPAEAPSHWANAGVWLFEPGVLDWIPAGRRSMVETELFPELLAAGARVQGYTERCFWADIGTPERYLSAQLRLLEEPLLRILPVETWPGTPLLRNSGEAGPAPLVGDNAQALGPVLVGAGVRIGAGAVINGPAVIGAGSVLGAQSIVTRSVLWDAVTVGPEATIRASVLADGCVAARGVVLESVFAGTGAAFGQGANVVNERIDRVRDVTDESVSCLTAYGYYRLSTQNIWRILKQ